MNDPLYGASMWLRSQDGTEAVGLPESLLPLHDWAGDLAIEYLLLHVSQVNEVCKKAEKSKKSAVEMISDIMPGLDWALELIDY